MKDDIKAWIIVIAVFFGLPILFAVFASAQPSRSEEPEVYYESKGYSCTDDCSGHDAGYEWAADNDVCDEDFSGGNSDSFEEGVRVYAEENCE